MSDRQQHRSPQVSPRTERRRHPHKLTVTQSGIGKRMRDQGYSFESIAEALAVDLAAILAESGKWRDTAPPPHGKVVINIKPDDQGDFRRDHCLPDEADWIAFRRLLGAEAYYRTFALAHGCPPYSGLLPVPEQPTDRHWSQTFT